MKKRLYVLLFVIPAFILCACGTTAETIEPTQTPAAEMLAPIQTEEPLNTLTEDLPLTPDPKLQFENSTWGDSLDEVLTQEDVTQILVEKTGHFAGLEAKAVMAFYPDNENRLAAGEYRFYKTLPNEETYSTVKAALVELYGDARQETYYDVNDAEVDAWTADGSAQAIWNVQSDDNSITPQLGIILESNAGEQVSLKYNALILP